MTPRWARRKRVDELRVARGMVRATLNPIIGHVGSTGRSKGNHEHLATITDLSKSFVMGDGTTVISGWHQDHQPRTEHP